MPVCLSQGLVGRGSGLASSVPHGRDQRRTGPARRVLIVYRRDDGSCIQPETQPSAERSCLHFVVRPTKPFGRHCRCLRWSVMASSVLCVRASFSSPVIPNIL